MVPEISPIQWQTHMRLKKIYDDDDDDDDDDYDYDGDFSHIQMRYDNEFG